MTEEAARYADKWFSLFDIRPTIAPSDESLRVNFRVPPTIEFRNVSFSYFMTEAEQGPYLKNISFKVNPCDKIAIVGPNGAGKTTLIKLLCRINDPTEGVILVNGIDLRKIHINDWHRSIGNTSDYRRRFYE